MSYCSISSVKEVQVFIQFGVLILLIGTLVGLPKNGYAQNITNEGSNIFDIRSQNITTWPNIHSNVKTDFNPNVTSPVIQNSAFIHPFAVVIGDCYIGKMVLVSPTAVCRGDEGTPIHVGDSSNMQDGVVLHALETTDHGKNIDNRRFSSDGDRLLGNDSRFSKGYAIFIGDRVSLAHDSMVPVSYTHLTLPTNREV